MKTFTISYILDRKEYLVDIKERTEQDAERILSAIKINGRISGETILSIPLL